MLGVAAVTGAAGAAGQYLVVNPLCTPPWAPVSIGLEGANGFDGLQVAFDDLDFPVAGTSIGFASSCGTAGENDCDAGDVDRAIAACGNYMLGGLFADAGG